MRRRDFMGLLGAGAAAWPLSASAQPTKRRRIGYLGAGSTPNQYADAFVEGLRALGYVDGQNVTIEWAWADGQIQMLPELAAKLVSREVDVIVAPTGFSALAAQRATTKIPIVVIAVHDGVALGLYPNLAHPGGNITGIDSLSELLNSKRMAMLKDVLTQLSSLTILYNPTYPGAEQNLLQISRTIEQLNIRPREAQVRSIADLGPALEAIGGEPPDAILVVLDPTLHLARETVVAFAIERRIPMIGEDKNWVQLGSLMSYGVQLEAMWTRGAYFVDRIFRGARAGDLPVEQPTVFSLAINLKTARLLGLTVPVSLLSTADLIIE